MYFSNGAHNQLVRFNVTSHEVKILTTTTTTTTTTRMLDLLRNLEPFNDVTTAAGCVSFSQTTSNVITRFDYNTYTFKSFKIPTPLALGVLNPKTGNFCVVVEPEVIFDAPVISAPFYGESGIFGYAVGQTLGKRNKSVFSNNMYYTPQHSKYLKCIPFSSYTS